jgi:hypothetical protein
MSRFTITPLLLILLFAFMWGCSGSPSEPPPKCVILDHIEGRGNLVLTDLTVAKESESEIIVFTGRLSGITYESYYYGRVDDEGDLPAVDDRLPLAASGQSSFFVHSIVDRGIESGDSIELAYENGFPRSSLQWDVVRVTVRIP